MRPAHVRRTNYITIAVSISLLVVGGLGAWFINYLHRLNSTMLARHASYVIAAEELEIEIRDVRNRLNRFLRTNDQQYLDAIPKARWRIMQLMQQARERSQTDEEAQQIQALEAGYSKFFTHFQELVSQLPSEEARQGLGNLIDDLMAREVFIPARRIVQLHQREMVQMAELETQVANRMGWELMLLALCGAVAGAMGGFGLARSLQKSLIQLSVSVHGMAGRLADVVEPLTIDADAPSDNLEQMLKQIAARVALVIERFQESQREVQRAEQLAMVGQLAAGLAHELRNAVMPAKLLVQSAMHNHNPMTDEDLQVVAGEIERLELAVNRLLEFARPSKPEKTLFDLSHVISESLRLISGRASSQRVRIHCDVPSGPALIDADKEQLRQVIINLLLNAMDAMPTGGELSLSLQSPPEWAEGELPNRILATTESVRQPAWALTIADTGQGIPPQILDHVFEPFVTNKPTGTGLGLSICQRIIEAHGGAIRAANRAARGAVFSIRLPAPAARPSQPILPENHQYLDAIHDTTAHCR